MIEDRKDAVVEASKMLRTPMNELPELATEYLKFLSNKVGLCFEVCLTAYAVYNQMVLDCDDDLYIMTDAESIKWWSDRGYERKQKERTPLKFKTLYDPKQKVFIHIKKNFGETTSYTSTTPQLLGAKSNIDEIIEFFEFQNLLDDYELIDIEINGEFVI